ncbi:hypothetical protein [Corynebacterium phocae]|uniref:hypothetical protein n=1 Tax=Corynebacterium phocae TaxID=161895 RepID=UPI0009525B11|nr:hypothetical protein [Corynebacterium phocae]KAA8723180.1 hypothetical protein F4V58_07650 [Corynebacterium phocae]
MKKFSRTIAAGLSAATALSLAACYPPNQQDSDIKVETGSTFTGMAPAQKEAEANHAEGADATEELDPSGHDMTGMETKTIEVLEITETAVVGADQEAVAVATPVATETVIVQN